MVCLLGRFARERESKREGKKKIKVWPKFNLKFEKFKV
jgi:hypothetical protein